MAFFKVRLLIKSVRSWREFGKFICRNMHKKAQIWCTSTSARNITSMYRIIEARLAPNSYSWHSSLENWAISKDKFESLYLSAIPPELGWSRMIYSWYVFASGTFKYRLRSSRGKIMTRNQSRLNLQLLLSHGQKNSNA